MKAAVLLVACALLSIANASPAHHLNQRPYLNAVSDAELVHRGTGFFDVPTTPTALRYGDVNNDMKTVGIPQDIVKAYDRASTGKVMAITGWESNTEQLDVNTNQWVPAKCTEVYNHHYVITLESSKRHSDGQFPIRQSFGQAEGNEHRNSFHGIAAGNVAILIDSPAFLYGNFHFINTKSPRCGNSTDCPTTGWGPGTGAPLPQAAVTPSWSRGVISGLGECPCSTRRGDYQHGGKILQDVSVSNSSGYAFNAGCKPGGQLLLQKNSICGQATYNGGLQCCYDRMNLLDLDQQIPPLVTTYRFRIRFHYESYTASVRGPRYDNSIFLFYQTEEWQTEYDVPPADPSTPAANAVHVLTTSFKAVDMLGRFGVSSWSCAATPDECLVKRRDCSYLTQEDCGAGPAVGELPPSGIVRMLYISMHSHVGVISGELIDTSTGAVLCKIWPIHGKSDKALDEAGYAVGIVPCIFNAGDDPSKPDAPEIPLNATLMAIARYNSSFGGHLGVMSLWEMRGAWA